MIHRAVRARLNSTVFLARTAVVLSALALLVALSGVTPATAVSVVKRALSAKNADAVDGISASRSPKARQLVPLGANRKLPRSVIPLVGTRGPRGPAGPPGAGGGATAVRFASSPNVAIPRQANLAAEVARLDNVPAGKWLLLWTGAVQLVSGSQATTAACSLQIGNRSFAATDATIGGTPGAALSATLAGTGTTDSPAPFSVTLRCAQNHEIPPGVDPLVHDQHIVAIRADELT